MEPEALSLGRDASSGSKCVVQKLEVWLLEERFGWSNWVRRIGDDHIIGCSIIRQELEAISDVDANTGRVKQLGHVRQVLLGDFDHSL